MKKIPKYLILIATIFSTGVCLAQFQRKNPTFTPTDSTTKPPQNPTSSQPTSTTNSVPAKKINLLDKISIGGNFSLSFGNATFVNISPAVGYRLTPKFMPGIGLTYIYYNATGISSHFYGGNVFVRYSVFSNFFIQAELEALRVTTLAKGQGEAVGNWSISPLIGGGYIIRLGKFGGIVMTLMYNLNYNAATSYNSSPVVYRLGFIF